MATQDPESAKRAESPLARKLDDDIRDMGRMMEDFDLQLQEVQALHDIVRTLMADRYRLLRQAWDDRICRIRNLKLRLIRKAAESAKTLLAMRILGI